MQRTAFAERLQRHLTDQNLTQSELARRLWGTMTDERGYEVAKNRQLLGKYLKGTIEPRIGTKRAIAKALDVPLAELAPESDPLVRPGSGIRMEEVDQTHSLLEVNLVVPKGTAVEVMKILLPYLA